MGNNNQRTGNKNMEKNGFSPFSNLYYYVYSIKNYNNLGFEDEYPISIFKIRS
jgi:hypothetical protein